MSPRAQLPGLQNGQGNIHGFGQVEMFFLATFRLSNFVDSLNIYRKQPGSAGKGSLRNS